MPQARKSVIMFSSLAAHVWPLDFVPLLWSLIRLLLAVLDLHAISVSQTKTQKLLCAREKVCLKSFANRTPHFYPAQFRCVIMFIAELLFRACNTRHCFNPGSPSSCSNFLSLWYFPEVPHPSLGPVRFANCRSIRVGQNPFCLHQPTATLVARSLKSNGAYFCCVISHCTRQSLSPGSSSSCSQLNIFVGRFHYIVHQFHTSSVSVPEFPHHVQSFCARGISRDARFAASVPEVPCHVHHFPFRGAIFRHFPASATRAHLVLTAMLKRYHTQGLGKYRFCRLLIPMISWRHRPSLTNTKTIDPILELLWRTSMCLFINEN